ncbi:hypothetical protein NHQ30_002011 [Ciborinia camelliae]|nr:hypothetical protein NHQ30_002011 [Ciborinia camelliae]
MAEGLENMVFINEKLAFEAEPTDFKDTIMITQSEILDRDIDLGAPHLGKKSGFPNHNCHEMHDAINHAAWTAGIHDHITETVVHGAVVIDPTVSFDLPPVISSAMRTPNAPPPSATGKRAPPEGFLLSGSILLFGSDTLVADFYGYHGPRPDTYGYGNSRIPVYQMAVLQDDLRLSSIIPAAKGKEFDAIALKDVTITYQNMILDKTKSEGFTMEASIVFDESYGAVHDVLSNFLGFNDPTLRMSCVLQDIAEWHAPMEINSFRLSGTFTDSKPKPACDKLQLTSVGLTMTGYDTASYNENGEEVRGLSYGFGLFGTMHLVVPGSILPLEMAFKIEEWEDCVSLGATLEGKWEHAFGISCLTLDKVKLGVMFDVHAPLQTLMFQVSATFEIGDTHVTLGGLYSTDGNFELSATLRDLDFHGLSAIFSHFFDDDLDMPEIDLFLGEATITISKHSGFSLVIHDLAIGDHTAADAVVEIGSAGVLLRADLDGDILNINDVEIKRAFVEMNFQRQGKNGRKSPSKTSVMFGGDVHWEGHNIDVGVHVYQSPEADKNNLEYTIIGSFKTEPGVEGLPFVRLVPELKGSFLEDVTLQNAALVIASRDDTALGAMNKANFPIQKGIRVCAHLGELTSASAIFSRGKHTPSLTLCAGWSPKEGFSLDILAPNECVIDLGQGIITDPFALRIVLGGTTPALKLISGAKVFVQGQKEPLHFTLDLDIDAEGAAATGQLSTEGGWINPMGLSEKLIIGPNLALKVGMKWTTFAVHGPGEFGFVGGISIGKVQGQIAFNIDENPSREMLYAKVERLDIQDVVEFASVLTTMTLEQPPNVVKFEKVEIYVCPGGTTMGTLVYPPGFSFSADVVLFDIHADVMCSVGSNGIICKGGIDSFSLGPLFIRGVNGPRAMFHLELTSSQQAGKIDGMVEIFGTEVAIVAHFELQPKLSFDFLFHLNFLGLYTFEVHAYPHDNPVEGSCNVTSTSYRLEAEFHKQIRGNIADNLDKMFEERARKERDENQHTLEAIESARNRWKATCEACEARLNAAHDAYISKKENTEKDRDRIVEEDRAKIATLQAKLDDRSREMKEGVSKAQQWLNEKNDERAARMRAETESLQRTESEWDEKIRDAHRRVDETTRALHDGFGSLEDNIREAREKVQSLENDADDIMRDIYNCENASGWDLPAKAQIPYHYTKYAGVEVAKEIADKSLWILLQLLESADYISCKGAKGAADIALDGVLHSSHILIAAAKAALALTDEVTNKLVQAANAGLENAGKLGQVAVDMANGLLEAAKNLSPAIIAGAHALVSALADCAEWLEYHAAELALKIAKEGGNDALILAEVGVQVGHEISQVAMRGWQIVMRLLGSLVDITDVSLKGELGTPVGNFSFMADVKGTIGKELHFFHYCLKFDTGFISEFMEALFDKLVDLIEEGILEVGNAVGKSSSTSKIPSQTINWLENKGKLLQHKPEIGRTNYSNIFQQILKNKVSNSKFIMSYPMLP